MKKRTFISLFFLMIIFMWVGYCIGNYITLEAEEKRKAALVFGSAKIMLSVANKIKTKDYEQALDILSQTASFYLFYIESTRHDVDSLNLVKFIIRPDIQIEFLLMNINVPFPDENEINKFEIESNKLKVELNKINDEIQ